MKTSLRTPYLITLLFAFAWCTPANTAPRELRGSWGSSGDMAPPWIPPYEYRYDCQSELTDHVPRRGQGGEIPRNQEYELFAVENFEFTKAHPQWQSGQSVRWVAILSSGEQVNLRRAPPGAFSPLGMRASLGFTQGTAPQPDQVNLAATAQLPLGDYHLSQVQSRTATRADDSFSVDVTAAIDREENAPSTLPSTRERALYVVCDKVN